MRDEHKQGEIVVLGFEGHSVDPIPRNKVHVSIIVCTKNNYRSLGRCLSHILSSNLSESAYEVIVIDSSNSPIAKKRVSTVCERFGVKYAFEPRSGIARARNTGMGIASGGLVVFLDDDIIVTRNTIHNLIANYQSDDIVSCTGRIVSFRNDQLSRLFERYSSFDRGPARLEITIRHMTIRTLAESGLSRFLSDSWKKNPPPYSLAFGVYSFRKRTLENIGGFDVNLGRGTPQRGGADLDMYYRILRRGYMIVYDPQAIAFHDHKHSLSEMIGQAYSNGYSSASLAKKHFRSDPYIVFLFLSDILLSVLRSLGADFRGELELRMLSQARLAGMFARLIRPLRSSD